MTAPNESAKQSAARVFTTQDLRAIDHAAINDLHIPELLLVEHAAIAVVQQARSMLDHADPIDRAPAGPVLIVCGAGNNGADGLATARLLFIAGFDVHAIILHASGKSPSNAFASHHAMAKAIGVPLTPIDRDNSETAAAANTFQSLASRVNPSLIIDALLGTGLTRDAEGPALELIDGINTASTATKTPVLAVDVPSGLDAGSGEPRPRAVAAARTATFVGLKTGFDRLDAQRYLGDVVICDIAIPRPLAARFGTPAPSGQNQTWRIADPWEGSAARPHPARDLPGRAEPTDSGAAPGSLHRPT